MAEEYRGPIGAYAFAFRRSPSLVFRSYVAVSALVGAYVTLLLVLALVTWVARPTGLIGEHALLVVVGILIVVPLFAPVLITARRHRHGRGWGRADLLFGLAGYAFVVAVVLALLITDPADHAATGPLRIVIAAADRLPRAFGVVPPIVGAALIVAVARLTRPDSAG